ncbi:tRNA (guanine-N(1)-)-methyltransferase [Buchnera aphidicola (Eriosoma grossulariae)]
MWIDIISIFPEMFQILTNYGIIAKAIKNNILKIKCWNPRNYTSKKRKNIDNKPYGGGPGMIMSAIPLIQTIRHIKSIKKKGITKTIYLSPQGKLLNQKIICSFSKFSQIILICGRYKGIDERIIEMEVDEEYSIGDYIISGGELAAMVFIDSLIRIQPGVLQDEKSFQSDSFYNNLLDCPYYTRPINIEGKCVPTILLSGNHEKIKKWRKIESLKRTLHRRPELLKKNENQ